MGDEESILDIVKATISQGKQDDRRRVKLCKEYKKIIRTLYPELNSRVYCVPPVHFNTVLYTPTQFSAATGVRGGARKGKTRAAEWHTQVDSRLEHVKADDAQHRTLRALKTLAADLLKESVFILSNLKFKDYLNYTPNKQASQTVARLPRSSELDSTGRPRADHGTAGGKAAKGDKVEGDWDVLLFHRDHATLVCGIVLLEVKSVGEGQDPLTLKACDGLQDALNALDRAREKPPEPGPAMDELLNTAKSLVEAGHQRLSELQSGGVKVLTGREQLKTAEERVRQALTQLAKGSRVIQHLVSDILPDITIRRSIVLPNISRGSLKQIFCVLEHQELDKLGVREVEKGLRCCLCQDDLPARGATGDIPPETKTRLMEWWENLLTDQHTDNDKHKLSIDEYENLVARFCGPMTTVRVYNPHGNLREVRTLSDAASATAECFSAIVLTEQQVDVLNDTYPQHVHITGAPGTGKTILLQCKATIWLRTKKPVIVVAGSVRSAYISHFIYTALCRRGRKLVSLFKLYEKNADFEKHLADVRSRHPSKEVLVVFDEFDPEDMGRVFTNIQLGPEKLHVWSASAWKNDNPRGKLDVDLKLVHLDRVMRSPPCVQELLKILWPKVHLYGVPCPMPQEVQNPPGLRPPPTRGPPVKLLSHADHQAEDIWDCKKCGSQLADYLKHDLHIGMPPELYSGRGVSRLDFRDVLVLSAVLGWEAVNTNHEKPFVKALKKQNVLVEFANPTRSQGTNEFPMDNKVVFSRCDSVLGWESKVIVFVPHRGAEGDHDVSDEEDASVAGVNGELAQLNREDENCKEDSLEFDLSEPTGANPHAQESHRSNMRQRRFTPEDGPAATHEALERAVSSLSHASQEDAYKAFSGTIAHAVLFQY